MHPAAQKLFARLSEVEKISLRMSTPGAIEHQTHSNLLGDMIILDVLPGERVEVATDAQALANLQFATRSADGVF